MMKINLFKRAVFTELFPKVQINRIGDNDEDIRARNYTIYEEASFL